MKTKLQKTKVLFRLWQGEVIALFPREAATVDNPQHCLSYEHFGQHGGADVAAIIANSRPAKPAEYRELAAELRCRGYRFNIGQRTGQADLAARKEQFTPKPTGPAPGCQATPGVFTLMAGWKCYDIAQWLDTTTPAHALALFETGEKLESAVARLREALRRIHDDPYTTCKCADIARAALERRDS